MTLTDNDKKRENSRVGTSGTITSQPSSSFKRPKLGTLAAFTALALLTYGTFANRVDYDRIKQDSSNAVNTFYTNVIQPIETKINTALNKAERNEIIINQVEGTSFSNETRINNLEGKIQRAGLVEAYVNPKGVSLLPFADPNMLQSLTFVDGGSVYLGRTGANQSVNEFEGLYGKINLGANIQGRYVKLPEMKNKTGGSIVPFYDTISNTVFITGEDVKPQNKKVYANGTLNGQISQNANQCVNVADIVSFENLIKLTNDPELDQKYRTFKENCKFVNPSK